jgi:hypothetical protein
LSGKSYSNKKTVMETYKENREKKFSKGISIVYNNNARNITWLFSI